MPHQQVIHVSYKFTFLSMCASIPHQQVMHVPRKLYFSYVLVFPIHAVLACQQVMHAPHKLLFLHLIFVVVNGSCVGQSEDTYVVHFSHFC